MFGRRSWRTLVVLFTFGSLHAGACSLGAGSEDEYFGTNQNSCAGICGSDNPAPGSSPECYCDEGCYYDPLGCCPDFAARCADGSLPNDGQPGSCQGRCGSPTPAPGFPECYCDIDCIDAEDCCSDYAAFCGDAG